MTRRPLPGGHLADNRSIVEPSGQRLEALRGRLHTAGVDALVVSSPPNVRYLSGFTGSSGALLITANDAFLATDSRYAEQSAAEAPGFTIVVAGGNPSLTAAKRAGPLRLGFESEAVSHAVFQALARIMQETSGGSLLPCRGLVEASRAVKSADEVALVQRAVDITSQAFEETLPLVRPGAVERDLALEIEFRMKRAGAEEIAFDLIVASGPRSALPHGRASDKRLSAGEFVVFDIGARHRGYHSDMTRTVHLGKPSPAARDLYETVLRAQLAGIEAAAPGVTAGAVDRAARQVIEAAGHGSRFGHGTGHGVGLQIHEGPRVGAQCDEVLEAGMLITVEPGVYIPGSGGVRIEDVVAVTPTGRRVLTTTPKNDWVIE